MSLRRWDNEKIAIAIFFAFRNANHEACAKILQLKRREKNSESRTGFSVRNKLDRIRKIEKLWSSHTSWNLKVVDDYLVDLNLSNLTTLMIVSKEKLAMISKIRRRAITHLLFWHNDRSIIIYFFQSRVVSAELTNETANNVTKSLNRIKSLVMISLRIDRDSMAQAVEQDWRETWYEERLIRANLL